MKKIKPKFLLFILALLTSINTGAAFSKPSSCNDFRSPSPVESAKTYINSWFNNTPVPPEQIALENVGYAHQFSSIQYRKPPRGNLIGLHPRSLVAYAVLSVTLTNNSKYFTLETACFECKYFDSQGNLIPISHSWWGEKAEMNLGVLLNPGNKKQASTRMWYTENEGRMISKYQSSLVRAW